jgi:hypothetical protein
MWVCSFGIFLPSLTAILDKGHQSRLLGSSLWRYRHGCWARRFLVRLANVRWFDDLRSGSWTLSYIFLGLLLTLSFGVSLVVRDTLYTSITSSPPKKVNALQPQSPSHKLAHQLLLLLLLLLVHTRKSGSLLIIWSLGNPKATSLTALWAPPEMKQLLRGASQRARELKCYLHFYRLRICWFGERRLCSALCHDTI